MLFGRSLIQRESLLRVSGEERSPEILISFHSSGSTSNQWRKLDHGFPVEPHFAQVVAEPEKRSGFSHSLLIVLVPLLYLIYLAEKASDRLEFQPSWDSMDQDQLSLYGQYQSTKVDHMDVEKAFYFVMNLFHFDLPSSYLCFVCSREEFYL